MKYRGRSTRPSHMPLPMRATRRNRRRSCCCLRLALRSISSRFRASRRNVPRAGGQPSPTCRAGGVMTLSRADAAVSPIGGGRSIAERCRRWSRCSRIGLDACLCGQPCRHGRPVCSRRFPLCGEANRVRLRCLCHSRLHLAAVGARHQAVGRDRLRPGADRLGTGVVHRRRSAGRANAGSISAE